MNFAHRFALFGLVLFTSYSPEIFAANEAPTMAQPNAEMKTILEKLKSENGKPIETLDAKEARKQPTPTDAVKGVMKAEGKTPPKDHLRVDNRTIPGAAGQIPARIYRPEGKANLPLIVYYHGGGFVIADKDVYDASARALAEQTGAVVMSVDYREAPEHKFPAAHDDAYAAYKFAVKNAKALSVDTKKIAVAGESAGGNLALNVALRARDQKFQLPVAELLVYPVAGSSMETASYNENADAKPLNKPMMGWFMKNYLNNPSEAQDKRINVIAADFKGLPPTTIITAQIDPLRSEGKDLAGRMQQAGVAVSYRNFDGVTHEFFGMAPVLQQAKEAQAFATSELKKSL